MERPAREGESPVDEITSRARGILSTAEQVKFCGKQPEPSGKAKYSSVTDSEQVP